MKTNIPKLDEKGKELLEMVRSKVIAQDYYMNKAQKDAVCELYEQITKRKANKGCSNCIPNYSKIVKNYINLCPEPIAEVKTISKKVTKVTKIEKNDEASQKTDNQDKKSSADKKKKTTQKASSKTPKNTPRQRRTKK